MSRTPPRQYGQLPPLLPPSAMNGRPQPQPPAPSRTNLSSDSDTPTSSQHQPPPPPPPAAQQRMPSGSAVGEFGILPGAVGTSRAAMSPTSVYAASPISAYPSSPTSFGSGRRALPTPPKPAGQMTAYEELSLNSRGRSLPTVPGTVPSPSRSFPSAGYGARVPSNPLPALPPGPKPPDQLAENPIPYTPSASSHLSHSSESHSRDYSSTPSYISTTPSSIPSIIAPPGEKQGFYDAEHEWQAAVAALSGSDGYSSNLTVRDPSRDSHSYDGLSDGRGTPTPGSFTSKDQRSNGSHLSVDHARLSSGGSVTDAGLPRTPKAVPEVQIYQQKGVLDGLPGDHRLGDRLRLDSHDGDVSSLQSNRSSDYQPGPSRPRGDDGELTPSNERPDPFSPRDSVSLRPSTTDSSRRRSSELSPSWGEQTQQPSHWVQQKLQIHQSHRRERRERDGFDPDADFYDDHSYEPSEEGWDEEGEMEEEEEEVNEIRFFQPAFLSEAALQLRDRVERTRQMKGGIAWVGSFTGKDIVSTIQSLLPSHTRLSINDRRFALIAARSLQNQLWFVEVDWDIKPLRDSSEDVFRFMGEMEGMGGGAGEALTSELPSGLLTMATRCYSPGCTQNQKCYSPRCPFKASPNSFLGVQEMPVPPTPRTEDRDDWAVNVEPYILNSLTDQQRSRQEIIRQAIHAELAYDADLSSLRTLYIESMRRANPPVISPPYRLEQFIEEVFANFSELHEACQRVLENFTIRERESARRPLIESCGDIFLQAAAEFRSIYPEYLGNLPHAEARMKKEMEENTEFRLFCERVVREKDRRYDLKFLITRPSTQLQRYPATLEAILNATDSDHPDRDFLVEALASIQNLSAISQLKLFHASRGRGPAGKMQWYDLVPEQVRKDMSKGEQKRQMQIWELIQTEMEYVADLETIDTLFVNQLRDPPEVPIIDRIRLENFLDDAFHNYRSLLEVHTNLLENLQARQLEQHPNFGMISDLILDAALNWQEAYMEYVTHYPVAKWNVQREIDRNPVFRTFLDKCLKDPASNRQDIFHFINRPIPRLLRYPLLLQPILKSLQETGPANMADIDIIPQVMELISDLGKSTQKGVAVNESKVDLWEFQRWLDGGKYGPRVIKDLDLNSNMRELIHRGKVYRQAENIGGSWAELIVLLFDNFLIITKPEKLSRSSRREERHIRYFVNRRPIPLELLAIGSFTDPPRPKGTKGLFSVGGGSSHPEGEAETPGDTRLWPFTISFIGQGQLGGQYTLWADTYAARQDWADKLAHAKLLRAAINDANKVFEMEPLSQGTFYMAPSYGPVPVPARGGEEVTGRVTCSVPFRTIDGRFLVAVGCDEGVWIGLRHDPRSLRKVLHVKDVTNIAVLEEFGIFLVLQDRSLLAYHLDALVPSANSPPARTAPQRLSPGKDIVFFTVGQLSGRTLVLYMKKKGMDSLFRVLEPILGRSTEDTRQRRPFGAFLNQRNEWFRLYKDFFIPTDALGVHFLKHKLVVVCSKGFEIMDLTDLKGGSIPVFDPATLRERPQLVEMQRRCETSKPLGMFRSTETEFLLCYDSFGIYVNRHGVPNRDSQVIEWEGRPERVAFHPPYLLLVSAPFIEIRHIDSATLLQIVTGSDMRLTWDGTGGMLRPFVDNPGPNGYGDETSSQEPRIHVCHRAVEQGRAKGSQLIPQHVFELTPTLALNNPLLNPVHTHDPSYFPPAPMITNRHSSVSTTSSTPYRHNNYHPGSLPGLTPPSEVSWDQ